MLTALALAEIPDILDKAEKLGALGGRIIDLIRNAGELPEALKARADESKGRWEAQKNRDDANLADAQARLAAGE